jgi:hypothetical protein
VNYTVRIAAVHSFGGLAGAHRNLFSAYSGHHSPAHNVTTELPTHGQRSSDRTGRQVRSRRKPCSSTKNRKAPVSAVFNTQLPLAFHRRTTASRGNCQ